MKVERAPGPSDVIDTGGFRASPLLLAWMRDVTAKLRAHPRIFVGAEEPPPPRELHDIWFDIS